MDVPSEKSKKPSDSAFKQQNLRAWQPILTAGTVLPAFFIVGILFVPVGIALLVISNKVKEIQVDYTDCTNIFNGSVTCASVIEDITEPCNCTLEFSLEEAWEGHIYIYYGLQNYYQNHRRYVKSRDDYQLLGHPTSAGPNCEPFDKNNGLPVAPCGAIANSLFNDTLKLLHYDQISKDWVDVPVFKKDIAWPTDKSVKFQNPIKDPKNITELEEAFAGTTRPPFWTKNVVYLDPDDLSNTGFQNEDLIVWMRTAALPNFRKLYRKIKTQDGIFSGGLPSGKYKVNITYNYPVKPFRGSKLMILSTTSWFGGKNDFLGIAYIVVGSLCLVFAIVFLVIHIKYGKNRHELMNTIIPNHN